MLGIWLELGRTQRTPGQRIFLKAKGFGEVLSQGYLHCIHCTHHRRNHQNRFQDTVHTDHHLLESHWEADLVLKKTLGPLDERKDVVL